MDRRIVKIIEAFEFPETVISRFRFDLKEKYQIEISDDDTNFVVDALKDFFIFGFATKKSCGMPSIIVDELWHTYILFTKEYASFCNMIGRFIHHSPEKVGNKTDLDRKSSIKALLRTYYFACQRELLNPSDTIELPLIFMIDGILPGEHGKFFDAKYLQEELSQFTFDDLK